jgi:hypothetical protein
MDTTPAPIEVVGVPVRDDLDPLARIGALEAEVAELRQLAGELAFIRPQLPMLRAMIENPQAHLGPLAKMAGLGRLFPGG